jgi:multiple sugar transport system substrate-binding protein
MKNQKWWTLILAVLIILSLCAACAQETTPPDEPAPPDSGDEVVEPAPDTGDEPAEPVTLVYTRYAGSHPYDLELIEKFMEENPNIVVEVNEVPGEESFNRLLLQMQGGQMPDVFWSHWVLAAATSGMAQPIDSFIEESGGQEYRDQFVPSAWDFVSWDGETYGVQWRDGASVAFFNQKLLDDAGLEVPTEWTWDDLLTYAQAMTDKDAGIYGISLIGSATDPGTEWNFWPFLLQAGGKILDEENQAAFNSPEGVEALQFMVDLIHKYEVAAPSTSQNGVNEVIDLFVSDKVGFWFNGPWYVGIMRATYPDSDVSAAPMPSNVTQGSIAGGTAYAISSSTEHPEEAWKLVEYMTQDEVLTEQAIETQGFPPNIAAYGEPFMTEDPDFKAVALQSLHPDTVSANHFPETDQLNHIIRSYIQAAYLLEMTPQEALDAAAAEWNEILVEYK